MSKLKYEPDMLAGIKLIETGYAPRGIAMLFGRRDTRIRYGSWRSKPLFMPDLELIGKIDFNKGEMELVKYADIQEIRADESTMARLKEFMATKAPDPADEPQTKA